MTRYRWSVAAALALSAAIVASCKKDESHPPVDDEFSGPPAPRGGGGSSPTSDAASADAGPGAQLAIAPSPIRGVAVSAAEVFFLSIADNDAGSAPDEAGSDAEAPGGGVVLSVPKSGGAVTTVVTGGHFPRDPSFTDQGLFWFDDSATGDGSTLLRLSDTVRSIAGAAKSSAFTISGTDAIVASASIGSISVDRYPVNGTVIAQPIGTLTGDFAPVRIGVDATTVALLASSSVGGSLFRAPLSGGVPEEIWSSATGIVRDMALSNGRALIALDKGVASEVVSVPLATGTPETLAANVDNVRQIAVVDADVYFTTESGDIQKLTIGSGNGPLPLVQGLGSPSALVVTDAIYVASGNSVRRYTR